MVVSIDRSITGSSYGNDLTATGERTFRITRTFVDRAVLGSNDGFDSAVRITLPADHPGHALELHCTQGIIVHKLVLLQFGTDGVVNPLHLKFNYSWYKRWWYVLRNTFT